MGEIPTSTEVIKTLENILAHKIFASSPKAQDFLRYIVMETLAGRVENLNGTTIAQDIFEKDANFDPTLDSVVRVTARRVRYMLQDYYSKEKTGKSIKISIPKGGYRPKFESNLDASHPVTVDNVLVDPVETVLVSKPPKYWLLWGAALLLVIAFVFTLRTLNTKSTLTPSATPGQYKHIAATYPSIAVIEFKNQTDDVSYDFLEQGLQKQMTEDLSRFTFIRPISYTENYESLLRKEDIKYDYAMTGIILSVEPEIDLYIKLMDLNQDKTIFENRIRRAPGQSYYYESLYNIVSELSGNFAGLEGLITKERLSKIQDKISADTDKLFNLEAFECYGLVGKLIESPSPKLYKNIYTCLETLLKEDPKNSTLLSAFGWITYVGATSHESVLKARSFKPDIDKNEGIAMLEESILIDPENDWAQQALSALKSNNGDIQGALKHAEMSVLANPANPDNLTWLSLCLAYAGEWNRAMPIAQEALDRNPEPSSQYYYTFFMKALHDNNAKAMMEAADNLTAHGNYYAKLYSYLAALASGDGALKVALQPDIDAMAARNNDDIMFVINTLIPSIDLRQKAEHLLTTTEASAVPN